MLRRHTALAVLIATSSLTLQTRCAPPPSGPAVGVSGDVESPFLANVSVRLVDPSPRPGQPVDVEVVVSAFGPALDVELVVTRQLHAGPEARDTLGTRTIGTLTAGDSVVVRYPVTFDSGPTTLRAAITGYDEEWEGELGKAAYLHALVYEGEAYVSGVSSLHARRDSVHAHQGILGRLFGWGEPNLAESTIPTDDGTGARTP